VSVVGTETKRGKSIVNLTDNRMFCFSAIPDTKQSAKYELIDVFNIIKYCKIMLYILFSHNLPRKITGTHYHAQLVAQDGVSVTFSLGWPQTWNLPISLF
jgi:hypothetical protein